jgi:AcrR family transcriptional regulator
VYSNFKGKDDLFLAVLDAEAQRRFPLHSALMLDAPSIEEGLRASAREMAQYAREHPGWTGVYVEFWTHASRRPELRRKVAEQHERLLDTVGGLVAEWASRWGVEFKLPAREVVRGTYAISRGLGLEALLADEPGAVDQLEEMFLAYAMGLIKARPGTVASGEGRLP